VAQTLDVRGLACPLPLIRARIALASLGPGEELIVLATDPEAPLDLAALATDERCAFSHAPRADGVHELRLRRAADRPPGDGR
jgi:tRNA 2-thiouridine synthesizing protein A